MRKKSRKIVTDLSCEEILRAIYFYVNDKGIRSIRIRLKGIWEFVNVKSLTKINNKIVFEF